MIRESLVIATLLLASAGHAEGSFVRRGVIAGTNPIHEGLTACWSLDEASGTRADSISGYGLTDNNTVTSGDAKLGAAAAQFTAANSEYLSKTDNADLSVTGDRTISLWFNLTADDGLHGFIQKYNPDAELFLNFRRNAGTRRLEFTVGDVDTNSTQILSTISTSDIEGTWYYVVARYRASDRAMTLRWNDNSDATGTLGNTAIDGTSPFEVGRFIGGNYMGGRIDNIKVWGRYLSDAELTSDYNGGAGVVCP